MAGDTVWLDVLPSMAGFASTLLKGATAESAKAGKESGAAFGKAFGTGANPTDMVEPLKKASAAAEKIVAAETQAIAKARAAQREATAKVIEAEDKLAKARTSGDSAKIAAAEERLAAARDRASGAASGVETAEKRLSTAANVRKDAAEKLSKAEADLANKTEKSGDKAGTSATAFGRFKDQLGETGTKAEGIGGKIAGVAASLAAMVGAAKLVGDGWSQALEGAGATGKLTAQLDLTAEQAGRAGQVAGDLYSQGFGGSVSDTTKAVGAVMSSISGMKNASGADLQAVTRQAQGFAQVFDVDVAEGARNAGVLIKTGLAKDATQAFDLMTAGLQKVPEALRGEVMDATQEYSQYFAQLGFSGSQSIGMLAKASEGGQYQIDKTGDALKEFTIRSTDMSKKTGVAYDLLGLDMTTMTTDMLAGGDRAKGAFDKIVGGLSSMKDPAAQSQAALALFGTPLEDIGTDKIPAFLTGLTGATSGLGDVSGKASEAAATIAGTVDPMESLKRSLTTTVAEGLQPFVGPAQQLADWARENPALMQGAAIAIGIFAVGLGLAAAAQWAMNSAMLANPMTWVILGIAALVAAIVLLIMNWDNVVKFLMDTFGPALTAVQTWFGDVGRKAGELWEGMKSGASGMVAAVGGFFESLKDTVMAPIRWIADNAINPLLDGIEKVAGFFGLSLSLPRLTFSDGGVVPAQSRQVVGGGQPLAYADGGVMPGYTPGRDVLRFVGPAGTLDLSGGEAVMRPEFTAAVGNGWVDGANAAARSGGVSGVQSYLGLASGGVLPNANGWGGVNSQLLQAIQAWSQASGYSGQVTGNGGFRSLADQQRAYANYLAGGNLAAKPGTSMHEQGLALDINPWPTAAQAAMLAQFGLGQTVGGEPWHIGLLGAASGGPVGFDPIQMLKDAIGSIAKVSGAGILGDVLNAVPGFLLDSAGKWLTDKVGALVAAVGGGSAGGGDVKALAQQMAADRGWTGSQWAALDWIVSRESGWNPNAQNPNSTAYGLFQFLNSTWATVGAGKTADPAGQISAGLQYIAQRYGTPVGAQGFWQQNGWYDQGGWLQPGTTMAKNGTGTPEAILTGSQWSDMSKLARAVGTPSIDKDVLREAVRRGVAEGMDNARVTITGRALMDEFDARLTTELGKVLA